MQKIMGQNTQNDWKYGANHETQMHKIMGNMQESMGQNT